MVLTMHIALAKCTKLPNWEVDDRPLFEAFAERGVQISHPAWDDASIDWSVFDACLIRTTWDYQEKHETFIAWAEHVDQVTRLFNPVAIVRWNTHKTYLRDLAERGAPIAPTVWLDAGSTVDVKEIVNSQGWSRAFIKPFIGSTSRETLRFDADEQGLIAAQAHLDRLLPNEGVMIQPYLERVETEGELSAIFIDGEITHTVRKIPVPGDYRVQNDFGARDEPFEFEATELDQARQIVNLVDGDLLYARVDFLRDDADRLCLSELEMVEPSLFFRHGRHAAGALAEAVCWRVDGRSSRPA
ncbi:MAG: hypothetical protein V3T84_13555 [Phycisphaerales bacterium]